MRDKSPGKFCTASGHSLATESGLKILKSGGSSVDAALSMAFTQWAVSAPTCGPGGDMFVMHVDGSGEQLITSVFGGWSRSPIGLNSETDLIYSGAQGAVVPGALKGAEAAWISKGRLPWRDLFNDSISACNGHEVTGWMSNCYADVERRGHGSALLNFFDEGANFAKGATVSSSRFGDTLSALSQNGASDFYQGELARIICEESAKVGSRIRIEDLAAQTATVERGTTSNLGDINLTYPGRPSQASILVDLLDGVSKNLKSTEVEFAKIIAPRTKKSLIDRCITGIPGTAVSMASDGNSLAVVVHSLAGVQFGTGWIAGDTGIAFGNRLGTSSSNRKDLPAANPIPGGVLPHTLSAALVERNGELLLIATPGGDRQVQWLAQAVQNFRQGLTIKEIVTRPRWFICPEGNRFGVPEGIDNEWFMFAESGIDWCDETTMAGFDVRKVASVGGGLQAISFEDNQWLTESDPRSGGSASRFENQHV